jgi:hypothetical protein
VVEVVVHTSSTHQPLLAIEEYAVVHHLDRKRLVEAIAVKVVVLAEKVVKLILTKLAVEVLVDIQEQVVVVVDIIVAHTIMDVLALEEVLEEAVADLHAL